MKPNGSIRVAVGVFSFSSNAQAEAEAKQQLSTLQEKARSQGQILCATPVYLQKVRDVTYACIDYSLENRP